MSLPFTSYTSPSGASWGSPALGAPPGTVATDFWSGTHAVSTRCGTQYVTPAFGQNDINTLGSISTGLSSASDGASLLLGSGTGALGGALSTISAFQADGGSFGSNSAKAIGTLGLCTPVAASAAATGCELGMGLGAPFGPPGVAIGCAVGGTAAGLGAYKGCEAGVGLAVDSIYKR